MQKINIDKITGGFRENEACVLHSHNKPSILLMQIAIVAFVTNVKML